jgi:pimeloyl-ACP methyl ester carboxylesterase
MNKKLITISIIILSVLMIFIGCLTPTEIENELEEQNLKTKSTYPIVNIRVNGQLMSFQNDQPPVIVNNRTMVPASLVFGRCGFSVQWNGTTQEVTVVKGINRLVFTINSRWVRVTNANVQNQWHQMDAPAMIINGRTMLPVHAMGDYTPVTSVYWDSATKTVNIQYWDELYTGITWLGYNSNFQKYIPGESNPHYNPNKPVIIYIHGWQDGSTQKNYLPHIRLQYGNEDRWTQNYWLNRGWNVGVFHWTQLADEPSPNVSHAEAKIWNANNGMTGMRWRRSDGTYETNTVPAESVGQLLFYSYINALSNHNGSEIRLVGHSLGNQLVTRLTQNLLNTYGSNHRFIPKRVTLIDPAYTSADRTYLRPHNNGNSISTAALCATYGQNIANANIPIEFYRSSGLMNIPGMSYNVPYQNLSAYIELKPWFIPSHDLAAKHSVPVGTYFWSIEFQPPVECTRNYVWQDWWPTGNFGPSASAPNWRIRQMMGVQSNKWVQVNGGDVDGRYTINPGDDWFSIESK